MKIEDLVRPNIRALSPYSTARDEYQGGIGIFLDANENPYGNGVNRYPDPRQKELKKALAQKKGVEAKNIFVGNGSDEAIDLCFRVFCEPRIDNAISMAPTYGMYRVAAATNDIDMVEVQLGEGFALDADKLLAAADRHTKLMFLCSPNNPTGNSLPREQIEYLLVSFDGMVVLDEAYIDFSAGESLLPDLARYANLIILQTLSKAWGMAGLRLGVAYASEYVVELFSRVKYPYNINSVTQQMALERLAGSAEEQVRQIVAQREWVVGQLGGLPVVKHIFPSDANFILVRFDDPHKVYKRLVEAGVIVRDRSGLRGCEGCLRITIGTLEENRKLVEILTRL